MEAIQQNQMTAAQQESVLRYTDIGLKWVAGEMSFDDVIQSIGNPERRYDDTFKIEYTWYPDNVMTVTFVFEKPKLINGEPRVSEFGIRITDSLHTNIPWERFESLGMKPIRRGDKFEDGRTAKGEFFYPLGIIDALGGLPKNLVELIFHVPVRKDSPFWAGATLDYLGEWISYPPVESNFRHTGDVRKIGIGRSDLTPEDIQQRYHASGLKYDEQKQGAAK